MAHNGFGSILLEGLESKPMNKRHVDKIQRRLILRQVCYGLLLLAIAGIVGLAGFLTMDQAVGPANLSVLSLPTSGIPHYWQLETRNKCVNVPEFYIEEVISFDYEILVLLSTSPGAEFPRKETLECGFSGVPDSKAAMAVHRLSNDRAAVLCRSPSDKHHQLDSILIDQVHQIHRRSVPASPLQWNASQLTYEAFPTAQDVVLFVHGINHTSAAHLSEISEQEHLQQFQCVYGGHFEMAVVAQAQEVFRCPHPPVDLVHHFAGKKISVKYKGNVLPSVAYYSPVEKTLHHGRKLLQAPAPSAKKQHYICSCTMVNNVAKFLKEWVYYHSHLGVEKFFLYDNNSDDDLEDVVASLGQFNVTTKPWPWVKTQEAGFSHCSLMAESECTWMLFTDVDEYFYPSEHFLGSKRTSILGDFIEESVTARDPEVDGEVGQISTFCHNFGPSGLTVSPPQGVTQGYTCRVKKTERHKSIVLLSSVGKTLANVIHHFTLKPGFGKKQVQPSVAVINHYKFQVWDEFKTKFHRRAATYVADWTENRSQNSKDRVPDLGTKAIKPADWESRYCEVQDSGLRNYTQRVFGEKDGTSLHLPWW